MVGQIARVYDDVINVGSGKCTERPQYSIDLFLNVSWKISVAYNGNVKTFLVTISNHGKLVSVVWVDFLLVKKRCAVDNANVGTIPYCGYNVRL